MVRGRRCRNEADQVQNVVDDVDKAITPQRLITNITNAVFTIFPKLGNLLTRQQANQLLTFMNVIGMLESSPRMYKFQQAQEEVQRINNMIDYELNVRHIATYIGVGKKNAVKFVRGCFATNGEVIIYPNIKKALWSRHRLLIGKFGDSIAQYITETIVGEKLTSKIVDIFPVFNRIAKNMIGASSAIFFILEGCNYVAMHEDRQKKFAPGQSNRIFVDEFLDYLREMDNHRYLKFQDEISQLLFNFDGSFDANCSRIIEHLHMGRFDEDLVKVRTNFEEHLKSQKEPDDEDTTTPVPVPKPAMMPKPVASLPASPVPMSTFPVIMPTLPGMFVLPGSLPVSFSTHVNPMVPIVPSPMAPSPRPIVPSPRSIHKIEQSSDCSEHDGDD